MGTYKDLNDYEIMYMVEENDDARDLLFNKYRPIIVNIANKYKLDGERLGFEVDDLVQEGYLGLYSAIRNYNCEEDALFYTYALLSIKSKILNALKIGNTQKKKSLNYSISLSTPIDYDSDLLLGDFIIDDKAINPDKVLDEKVIFDNLRFFLYSLDINRASIFELNLNGFNNRDISNLLNCPVKTVANTLFRVKKKLINYYDLVH